MSFNFSHEDNSEEIVAQINMTPLIDIMLVLLIIFMVTSSISLESGISVALPRTSQDSTFEKKDEGKVTRLNLHQNGIDQTGRKLGPEYTPPAPRVEVEIEPEILKRFPYRLAHPAQ